MLSPANFNKLRSLTRSFSPKALFSTSYSSANKSTFYHKDLQITKSTKKLELQPKEKLKFGHGFTDHMLEAKWTREGGWEAPKIVPFHDLTLHPASSVLHYALECFEGSKAYKGEDGKIRLFRIKDNMKRMNSSTKHIALPEFDIDEAAKCIEELVRIDSRFVPEGFGYSMYLRPTMIATEPALGVNESNSALFYTIANPAGPYFPTGFKAVRLYADTEHVRAWPGGTGNKKLGSNYDGGMYPSILAKEKGYQQILWLFGEDHLVTEAGTMNAFIFWVNDNGVLELLTPSLDDGTILPGITRDSILQITRKWGEFQVTEGSITMKQVLKASREGRIREFFGAGTACVISPVKEIGYNGMDIQIPLDINDPTSESGPLAKRIYNEIMNIQYGNVEHEWSTVVE
ncbi:Branched-chain-amino-acid aminotransferase [Smittium culicis]|uniref:Branched-chain-amino-acid aminotransferase n=2 Tax=Smittium culicis TaxID=133412 RepID=A0A1R1XE33_9FUNG|nr:Branched-chain-amino-acid aminotransferase [Smittium culicis]